MATSIMTIEMNSRNIQASVSLIMLLYTSIQNRFFLQGKSFKLLVNNYQAVALKYIGSMCYLILCLPFMFSMKQQYTNSV